MSQQFTSSQRSILRQRFIIKDEDRIPVFYLDTSSFIGSSLQIALDDRYLLISQSSIFATASQGALADTALQPGEAATPAQGALADTALQPGDAATPAQGALADTAVQPVRSVLAGTGLTGGGDLSADRTLALSSGTVASLALADSAVQYTPTLRAHGVLATGGSPQSIVIPNTPVVNSDVVVLVDRNVRYPNASDPPAAGNFFRSGSTIKTNTTAGEFVLIYYMY